jgi:hypothetical protein
MMRIIHRDLSAADPDRDVVLPLDAQRPNQTDVPDG